MDDREIFLQCLIFRIDFKSDFNIVDKRGYIAAKMNESEFFDTVGLTSDGFTVKCGKDKPYTQLSFSPSNINGRFEKACLDIKEVSKFLKFVNQIFKDLSVPTRNIKRFGSRFFYMREEKDFNATNKKYLTFFADKLFSLTTKNSIPTKNIFDSSFSIKYSRENISCRMSTGPIKKEEYAKFFESPKLIEVENGSYIDFDYYTKEYQYNDLHLEKFVEEANKEVLKISKDLLSKLG